MPVSALLLDISPPMEDNVSDKINSMQGAQVYARENGKMVVVTDSPDTKSDYSLIEQIEKLEGVQNASVVFNALDDSIISENMPENGLLNFFPDSPNGSNHFSKKEGEFL